MSTPSPPVLLENLYNLGKRWNTFLSLEEMNRARSEIDCLNAHIRKGCLSGLKPGEGTESNERLHKNLNKSLLFGATMVGPEIAIAIISLIFLCPTARNAEKSTSRMSK